MPTSNNAPASEQARTQPNPAANGGSVSAPSRAPTSGSGAPASTLIMGASGSPAAAPQTNGDAEQRTSIDECPGPLSQQIVTTLKATNLEPNPIRWLYPYAKTVFPQGIAAPVLQWDNPAPEAVYLHLSSARFEYEGCFTGTGAARLAIPQAAWTQAGERSGGGAADPLQIELRLLSGGRAQRLPVLSAFFARATLKGAIYYNTYNSAIANAMGIASGVIMRTLPTRSEPEVFVAAQMQHGDCVGCHTVSANGGRMLVASHHDDAMGIAGEFGATEGPGFSFDLQATGGATRPAPLQNNLKRSGFAALYPDGSRYLSQGAIADAATPGGTLFRVITNVWGSFGPETSKLFDANTGSEIPNSGIIDYAYMPTFSVDGSMLAFNPIDQSANAGHALAVMDFDRSQDKFSNSRTVFSDEAQYPGWPFFLPEIVEDGIGSGARPQKRLVFALGGVQDFATQDAYLDPTAGGPHPSDLWYLDVDSGQAAPLARANGLDETGNTYLPYGDRDLHKNYYPTVSPVAAGGYFWLFFTSKRNYGNLGVNERAEDHPEAKKIWVAALDIRAPAGSDPSHPAFFLPGQELSSGNTRAFATLDACRAEGDSCEVGVDCCCGFCEGNQCACHATQTTCTASAAGACAPPPWMCARTDEKCANATDCCDKAQTCIGGFCGFRGPD